MTPSPLFRIIPLALVILPGTVSAGSSAASEADSASSFTVTKDLQLDMELRPSLHLHGVGGVSSRDPEGLATGGHDPRRETFSAQALEPGLSLQAGQLEGFSNYLWGQEADGTWDGHLEEAFLKLVDLPGGFEVRGGRMLSRFGTLNDRHLHAWDFVDGELANSKFLGEDGLLLEGADLTWTLPTRMEPYFTALATLGFGQAPAHGHAPHEEHEPGHEDEEGALYESDEGFPMDDVVTARLVGRHRPSDFHQWTGGISAARGTNGFDRGSHVWGIDLEYQWRENGLESGGRAFRWRNELLRREVEAFSEHDEDDDGVIDETHSGTFDETGLHTHVLYTAHDRIDTGLRLAWLGGIDEFGDQARFRVSPAVTFWLTPERKASLRAQYNFDAIEDGKDGHALWLQVNILLGGAREVR